MMRHQQQVGADLRGRQLGQPRLHVPADVAGEQRVAAPGADAQHAGAVVAQIRKVRRRMQQLELDAVPAPALSESQQSLNSRSRQWLPSPLKTCISLVSRYTPASRAASSIDMERAKSASFV